MYDSSDEIMKKQNLGHELYPWNGKTEIEIVAYLPLFIGGIIVTGLYLVFNNKSDGVPFSK